MLIAAAVLIAAAIIYVGIRQMTQKLDDAITNLTTEVTETLTDVAQKLSDIANSTDDSAAADAINAQASRLNDFQATLTTPAEPPPEAA